MSKPTVCAVICTYNRRDLLVECLTALAGQSRRVDRVLIVDNASTDGTLEAVGRSEAARRLDVGYIEMTENTGASGGFAEGVGQALSEGYDWLWMIDNDCMPRPDALAVLLDSPQAAAAQTVALCSALQSVSGHWQTVYRGLYRSGETVALPRDAYDQSAVAVDYAAFAGLLVRGRVAAMVGPPKAEFFLWVEDLEWCLRLGAHGSIWLIPASVALHRDGNPQVPDGRFTALRLALRALPDSQVWKHIYCFRNMSWIRRHYHDERIPGFVRHLARHWFRVLVFDRHKARRMRWYLKYGLEGRRGEFHNCQPDVWVQYAGQPSGYRVVRDASFPGVRRQRRSGPFNPRTGA